jgi:hypothetical protein
MGALCCKEGEFNDIFKIGGTKISPIEVDGALATRPRHGGDPHNTDLDPHNGVIETG